MKTKKIRAKKADILWEEVLKVVIAVICIGLLFILAWKLYGLFFTKSATEQAKQSIKTLYDELDKVQKGQVAEANVFIESPKDWEIIAWPNKLLDSKPSFCKADYCICLCEAPSVIPDYNFNKPIDRSLNLCISSGSCRDVYQKVVIYDKYGVNNLISIGGPIGLKINSVGGTINVREQK
jgi:hypothetical protein